MTNRHHPRPVQWSCACYRGLVKLYPQAYRQVWGADMEQLFSDSALEAYRRAGGLGLTGLWVRTAGDLAASLAREFWSARPGVRLPFGTGIRRGDPLRNFTPRAQQALAGARKEARRSGHGAVGTEHLLLAVLKQPQNLALRVLEAMDVSPAILAIQIEERVEAQQRRPANGPLPFTHRVKQTLARAGKEAQGLGHRHLGCEHLLLALTLLRESEAQRILHGAAVTPVRCREEIRRQLVTAPNR